MENTASRFCSQIFRRATDTKSESQLCLTENAPLKNAGVGLVQRKTQSAALLRLLIDAHGSWVPPSASRSTTPECSNFAAWVS